MWADFLRDSGAQPAAEPGFAHEKVPVDDFDCGYRSRCVAEHVLVFVVRPAIAMSVAFGVYYVS